MQNQPAILGGEPTRPAGIPAWPIQEEDVRAAFESAFASGDWGRYHGTAVPALIQKVSEHVDCEFVTPCCSGTTAIELGLRGLNVKPGDEVIMSAYDFRGNFHAVLAVGAIPMLVDVRSDDFQISVEQVASAISDKTKAILASHLHGGGVEMPELRKLADQTDVGLLEDACQCSGTTVAGRPAGTWGDAGVWSFGGTKMMTSGQGGVVFTNNGQVNQRIRLVQNRHNIAYPLSELQATVLLPQLDLLSERNEKREAAREQIIASLQEYVWLRPIPMRVPDSTPGTYKIGFQFNQQENGLTRRQWVAAMRAEGVAFDVGFEALHQCHSRRRFQQLGSLDNADIAHQTVVCLHHPVLLNDDIELNLIYEAVARVRNSASEIRDAFESGDLKDVEQPNLQL